MGCRNGGFPEEKDDAVRASLTDALLFTTMCIVGVPVDVYIKDGSIYSGIFYTARLDDGYAIVLKKARMIKKGTRNANVANGNVIETLIVESEDLVQVVAKGVRLPAEGISGDIGGNDIGASDGNTCSAEYSDREATTAKCNLSKVDIENGSRPRLVESVTQEERHHGQEKPELRGEQKSCGARLSSSSQALCSSVPGSSIPVGRVSEPGLSSSSASAKSVSVKDSSHRGIAKESKLNPGAKVFSPSIKHHRSVTPPSVPAVASVSYLPDTCSAVPVVAAESDVGINSFTPPPSMPMKFVPFNNMVAGNGGTESQHGQPFIGHVGSRVQPVRYTSQYLQLQAGPPYAHANSQNVMMGRLGPVLYVHPVSHGFIQNTVGLSQASVRPFLSPHQVNLPKHQGGAAAQAFQLCVAPPFLAAGGQQSYAVPSHLPISQPVFPVVRPIAVPGPNDFLGSEFA